ncbi:MAG: response regulator transcription factor [Anaerolineaceae bacterium]|jgi:DNA-binding response OmpR family regulator|nr:response regulator transcription factor [Anaerolineaceae bacterium]
MRILLVDDEEDFSDSLSEGLRNEGYVVDIALNGEEALFLYDLYPYDLALLDLNLPDTDGLVLCENFRSKNPKVLICILSARGEVFERIDGLDQGADDYLSKPIHFDELLARIRALWRRNLNVRRPLVEVGQLSIDTNLRLVYAAGSEIKLTAKEYRLLEYLTQNIGRAVAVEELILHIWGEQDALFSNSVRTQISYLRTKLRKAGVTNPVIVTTVNIGYTLVIE